MGDIFPLGRGRHHFFPKRPFKAALSATASASSCFGRVFVLRRLQPLGLRDLHPTELGFYLSILASLTPCLRHEVGDRHAGLMLLQNPD